MIPEKIIDLWIFLLLLLFLVSVVQGLKYLFVKIKLKREKQDMRDRLQSDRVYHIFQRKPQLRFDIFYDTTLLLRIANRESFSVKDINLDITLPNEKMSLTIDAPLGNTEIPLNIDIPSGELELNADFTYMHKFQKYSERITRHLSIKIPKKDIFHKKSIKEIKKEYRKLVKKYHPDLAKNEEERKYFESQLEKINEEYSQLLKNGRNISK
ncbi:MAG: DnaJ domain-containing protein [Methanomicrobia archaeon]|nr:DnaJ domain-containing protein [Methanomicrobia archaeon]